MISTLRTQRIKVYKYQFELHVTHCKLKANYPGTFFLRWQTGTAFHSLGIISVEDKHAVGAITDTIPFNSTLNLTLDMPYD